VRQRGDHGVQLLGQDRRGKGACLAANKPHIRKLSVTDRGGGGAARLYRLLGLGLK
jgi:hypothetical protein